MRPDFLSRLGADLCFDELSRTYLNYTSNLQKFYPPITGAILPENMPDYRGPVVRPSLPEDTSVPVSFGACNTPAFQVDYSIAPILTAIKLILSGGHHFNLHTYPILLGHLTPSE